MDLIYIGKIVNTHGIKGEVRILSDFEYKEDAFKVGNTVFVKDDKLIINSYRKHKNYDMITFKDIYDINDVLKYKGENVYIERQSLSIKGILYQDLINMDVYDLSNNYRGKIIDIYKSNKYDLLVIQNKKNYMVPYIDEFVKKIDESSNRVIINYIKGLEDED